MDLRILLVILQWIIQIASAPVQTTSILRNARSADLTDQNPSATTSRHHPTNNMRIQTTILELLESQINEEHSRRVTRQLEARGERIYTRETSSHQESQRQFSARQEQWSSERRQRHSSQRRIVSKLMERMDATNSSESSEDGTYATVYIDPEGQKLPRYECPAGKWACPTPKRTKKENGQKLVTCIEISALCDYYVDCPRGDDEEPSFCAFYRQNQMAMQELRDLLMHNSDTLKCKVSSVQRKLENHYHDKHYVSFPESTNRNSCGNS